jgi:metal-responsive CopG/Arc/MetJ family transcriptional regulator
MPKKIIQVPVEDELVEDLDKLSRKQGKSRSELIRRACLAYLRHVKEDELDKIYQRGYLRVHETPEIGEAQERMSGEVLSRESW